ncbi:MAG: sugar phosphate isomerase/epimerase [Ruminococcaceae bacterium]|nr:sugar phosphate isomerase/epimerase [Oscillospiraceae bacterium]
MSNIKIYAFADESDAFIDGQIDALKRNGLNGIEIRNVDGTNVSDITVHKAKEVKDKFDSNGLSVWSIGSPIGKINIESDDFVAHIEKFKHTLEISKVLNATNIRIFSFYIPEGRNPDIYENEVVERLGRLLEIAKPYGVDLCHENEKGIFGDISERCLKIHKALPELKAVFDPANFVQCGQNTISAWNELSSYVKYIHIKDSTLLGDIVPAGEGEGNVKLIAEKYIEFGGRHFTMEPHLVEFDGLKSLEREGEQSKVGKVVYKDAKTAFDYATATFKGLIGKD